MMTDAEAHLQDLRASLAKSAREYLFTAIVFLCGTSTIIGLDIGYVAKQEWRWVLIGSITSAFLGASALAYWKYRWLKRCTDELAQARQQQLHPAHRAALRQRSNKHGAGGGTRTRTA